MSKQMNNFIVQYKMENGLWGDVNLDPFGSYYDACCMAEYLSTQRYDEWRVARNGRTEAHYKKGVSVLILL